MRHGFQLNLSNINRLGDVRWYFESILLMEINEKGLLALRMTETGAQNIGNDLLSR